MTPKRKFKPTHEGWYWFCPIEAILYDDGIEVQAKWFWLEPLFTLADVCEQTRIFLTSAFDDYYEPSFMFKLRKIRK